MENSDFEQLCAVVDATKVKYKSISEVTEKWENVWQRADEVTVDSLHKYEKERAIMEKRIQTLDSIAAFEVAHLVIVELEKKFYDAKNENPRLFCTFKHLSQIYKVDVNDPAQLTIAAIFTETEALLAENLSAVYNSPMKISEDPLPGKTLAVRRGEAVHKKPSVQRAKILAKERLGFTDKEALCLVRYIKKKKILTDQDESAAEMADLQKIIKCLEKITQKLKSSITEIESL